MPAPKESNKRSKQVTLSASVLLICICFSLSYSAMKEASSLFYKGTVTELKDSTITVPEKVVAIFRKIRVSGENALIKPVDITINGITSSTYEDTVFVFTNYFPLTGTTTVFHYVINYKLERGSISGEKTSATQPYASDSGSFSVSIDPGAVNPPTHFPHGFALISWKRDLQFCYNNVPITYVNETMNPIQLRYIYSPDEAQYHYTKANIEVTNTAGVIKDKETYALTKSDTTFSGSFQRVLISNVTNPNIGNAILQHQGPDTLIATFRNQENQKLPMDSIQIKVPFRVTGSIDILRGYYFDNNADGYVDSIYVVLTTDLAGGLTINHVNQIKDSIILPAFRKLTIDGQGITAGGFYLKVTESKSNNPTTSVTKDDSLIVKVCILPSGGLVTGKKAPIHDKIAPLIHWSPRKAFMVDHIIDTMFDTLGVTFSETVRYISSKEPFYIKSREDNTIFTPLLTPVSQPRQDSMVFVVDKNNTKFMKDGDSIWIHDGSRVGDVCMSDQGTQTYNYQNNANNTRRRSYVDLKSNPYSIFFKANSPLNVNGDSAIIPYEILDLLYDSGVFDGYNLPKNENGDFFGMLIRVGPNYNNCLPRDYRLRGTIMIFDEENNLVAPLSRMVWDEKNKSLVWVWSLYHADPGHYFCQVITEDITMSMHPNGYGRKRVVLGNVIITGNSQADSSGKCGANPALAFIPPIGFKMASMYKRRKKWWHSFFKRTSKIPV